MATVKPIKPKKPVDYVGYEPVMIAVSKARAMAWVLEQLGEADGAGNNLVHALEDTGTPEKTREWLHAVVGAALRAARRHRGRVPQARNEPAREGVRRGGSQAEGRYVMATPRRSDRPGLLLWLNTTVKLRACLIAERGVTREEMTVRPEDTLRAAGISSKRQARYQQRMSSLLAGR